MPWDFPVEVNNLEADAFCRWKSERTGKPLRLISHEESLHMRQIATRQTSNANLNNFASPTPVNLHGGWIGGRKVFDISGNVWRHSVSVLTIMEGFKTDPFYTDFTLPTIDGFHNHILGGSWISLGNCFNHNARYGFRCCIDLTYDIHPELIADDMSGVTSTNMPVSATSRVKTTIMTSEYTFSRRDVCQ